MSGRPARLPALGEVNGIPGQLIDVDSERPLRCVASSKGFINQLKISPTSLAEFLSFRGINTTFWTEHCASKAQSSTLRLPGPDRSLNSGLSSLPPDSIMTRHACLTYSHTPGMAR